MLLSEGCSVCGCLPYAWSNISRTATNSSLEGQDKRDDRVRIRGRVGHLGLSYGFKPMVRERGGIRGDAVPSTLADIV
jgi:hypothetical protein